MLPIEIINIISKYLDYKTKILLSQVNKNFYNEIEKDQYTFVFYYPNHAGSLNNPIKEICKCTNLFDSRNMYKELKQKTIRIIRVNIYVNKKKYYLKGSTLMKHYGLDDKYISRLRNIITSN